MCWSVITVLPAIKSMTNKYDGMLKGNMDSLPPKSSSEIRIFLSSTFSGQLLMIIVAKGTFMKRNTNSKKGMRSS